MAHQQKIHSRIPAWLCACFVAMIGGPVAPALGQCREAKLTYSGAEAMDLLGWSVDVDGDWIVSGMNHSTGSTAKIVVWQRIGDQWVERDALYPDGLEFCDNQWIEAAISGDVLVGGGWNDYEHQSGLVYVYRRLNGQWTQEQRIEPFLPESSSPYIHDVDVSGDFIFIGSPNGASPLNRGVRVYRFDGATWTYLQTLSPVVPGTLGRRISADGNWVAAQAYHSDTDSYAIYLYQFDGQTWNAQQVLQSPPEEAQWLFAITFNISGDRLIVGSWQNTIVPYESKVRIYRLEGQTWIQETELTNPDPQLYPRLTYLAYLDGDRAAAVTGVTGMPGRCAAVHSFRNTQDHWEYEGSTHVYDTCNQEWFGTSLALSGATVAVGAILDDEAVYDAGAVHAFDLDGADCNNNGVCDAVDIREGTSWDIDGDGIPEECDCVGDLNGDRVVDLDDLAQVLGYYGATADVTYYHGDLDFDGDVDLDDLAEMLSRYGDTCPWPM